MEDGGHQVEGGGERYFPECVPVGITIPTIVGILPFVRIHEELAENLLALAGIKI